MWFAAHHVTSSTLLFTAPSGGDRFEPMIQNRPPNNRRDVQEDDAAADQLIALLPLHIGRLVRDEQQAGGAPAPAPHSHRFPRGAAPSHSWSNLIIPYHSSGAKSTNQPSTREKDKEESVTSTDTEKKEAKKKNPYSIEELLKKPAKKTRPLDIVCVGVQQPYGGLVVSDNSEKEAYQSGSDSDLDRDVKIDVE
ncbi:hypothetical protein NQ318_006991 [Aromia moschata]|uniref:Uncharacterized protein n=1 Tax=Aromia moschata TaxID=1265417 RepID=A0AAV8X1G1_9CUCU|nr:hypothetical protein NQ318_006991 [Aromia moschata]